MADKLKILLVRPKYWSLVAHLEPLGLEYVKGLCNEIGVECDIHDEFVHPWWFRLQRMSRIIKKGGYNYVGFSANANSVDYINKRAAQLKKRFPDITIQVGGPDAEQNYKDYCTEGVDIVYYDNGLTSLKNVFTGGLSTDNLEHQNGICFRKDGEWVFREKGDPVCGFICKPDRSHFYKYLRKNYIFLKGKFAISKGSFSCPFNCKFCYCTKMNSGVYTERAIEEIIEDVESINHDKIWFVDDTFFCNRERVVKFCNMVLERGIHKQFMAYSRADFLAENEDILPLAYKAGFRDMMVGLEAITDDQLDMYNKQTSKNENILAIKHLHDNNIVCNALFVISYTATKADFKNLLKFIKDNNLLWVVFGIFTPYKGTDAYEEYKDRVVNFKSKRLDGLHITIPPENMTPFMFMLGYYWLHLRTYPKIALRTLLGTAYDTKKGRR